jgi:negative regulator of flagellin synthesis FlgM
MEISRPFKPVLASVAETSATAGTGKSGTGPAAPSPGRATPAENLPLEQLQQALRDLPEVDLEKVTAIKLALQRGEISVDSVQLAACILAYHRGSDV